VPGSAFASAAVNADLSDFKVLPLVKYPSYTFSFCSSFPLFSFPQPYSFGGTLLFRSLPHPWSFSLIFCLSPRAFPFPRPFCDCFPFFTSSLFFASTQNGLPRIHRFSPPAHPLVPGLMKYVIFSYQSPPMRDSMHPPEVFSPSRCVPLSSHPGFWRTPIQSGRVTPFPRQVSFKCSPSPPQVFFFSEKRCAFHFFFFVCGFPFSCPTGNFPAALTRTAAAPSLELIPIL